MPKRLVPRSGMPDSLATRVSLPALLRSRSPWLFERRAYELRDEECLRLKILTCMLPAI